MDDRPELDPVLLDLLVEWEERKSAALPATPEDVCRDHPELIEDFRCQIERLDRIHKLLTVFGDAAGQPLPRIPGYELLEELGRGGMGVVYRARDVALDLVVAVKIPNLPASAEISWIRFEQEARILAKLRHPGVVSVLTAGIGEGGPYFVMEYVSGGSLRGLKDRLRAAPEAAVAILAEVARAVHRTHQKGIIHRDLKPSNILIDETGQPLVSDFGVATMLAGESLVEPSGDTPRIASPVGVTRITCTGRVVGTREYAAPEVLLGDRAQPAADIWSLGIILHELLTGELPAASNPNPRLDFPAQGHASPGKAVALPDRGLERIVSTCLAARPEDRYASAGEVADALTRWGRRKRHVKNIRRGALPVAACGLVLVGIAYTAWPPDPATNYAKTSLEARARLRKGEPAELISKTARDVGYRVWLGDEDVVKLRAGSDGSWTLDSGLALPALVELVDYTETGHYRLSAEVRQDTGENHAFLGLYFAGQVLEAKSGSVYTFGRLKYSDIDTNDEQAVNPDGSRANMVSLEHCRWVSPYTKGNLRVCAGVCEKYPLSPLGTPATHRWRKLSIEVSENVVRGFFDGVTRVGGLIGDYRWDAAQISLNNLPRVDPKTLVRVGIPPRGGLGLLVYRCKASFRNVRVDPVYP